MASRLALYVSEGADLVHYSLDVAEATLTRRKTVSTPQTVQYAWSHPTNRFLYVASSTGPGTTGIEHYLTAFTIGSSGELSQHGESVRLRQRPIHMTVDGTGRYILTAYTKPSSATVHRIGSDGHIGEEVPQSQDLNGGNHGHQVRVLPSNRGAVLVARGVQRPNHPSTPGSLQIYSFNDGVLRDTQTVKSDIHFGPRHLDFHPTKPWVYVSLEHQNELQVFGLENDRFSDQPLFKRPLLAEPDNVRPRQMGGAIHVHPNGRYVYIANRGDHTIPHEGKKVFGGGENSIAVFEIDQNSGEPKRIQLADPLGFYIRCFALDPSGQMMVTGSIISMNVLEQNVVRELPRTLALFRVGSDGKLTIARKYDLDTGGKKQWWLNIVELPA